MPKDQIRYYLHGDQTEEDPNLWRCSRCDFFVPEDHFSKDCYRRQKDTNHERYCAELKSLPIYMKNTEGRKRRPTNPPNCHA